MEEARSMMRGGFISAVNLSEVYQKSMRWNKLATARSIVAAAGLEIVPFCDEHAMVAAGLAEATQGHGVSFADRACLALGMSRKLPVVTGDRSWRGLNLGIEVVLFRPYLN